MKTVVISAGHSITDAGAVYSGAKEAEITMKIRDHVFNILRIHGVGVLRVPDNLDLQQTIQWINSRPNEIALAVELHINSAPVATGAEVWHYHNSTYSKKLSQHIVDAISVESGLKNRGVKDEYTNRWGKLGFVHDTNPLACLVESGFIQGDYAIVTSEAGQYNIAKGVCRGMLEYMGMQWKPELLNEEDKEQESINAEIEALKKQIRELKDEHAKSLAQCKADCEKSKDKFIQEVMSILEKYK